jgi:hypothetical protein
VARRRDDLNVEAFETWMRLGRSRGAAARELGIPMATLQHRLSKGLKLLTGSAQLTPGQPIKLRVKATSRRFIADGDATRVLVVGDAHDAPGLPKARFRLLGQHVARTKPDVVVWIGDVADFDSCSTHVGNDTALGKIKPSIDADLESVEEALTLYRASYTDHAQGRAQPTTHFIEGNHDERLKRFENLVPQAAGVFTQRFRGLLDQLGWHYHPFGELVDVAGVLFVHVPLTITGKPVGGQFPAATVGRNSTQDVVMGHSHKAGVHMAPKIGDVSVRVFDVGCFLPSGYRKAYARHSMGSWWYGLVELSIRRRNVRGWAYVDYDTLTDTYGPTE